MSRNHRAAQTIERLMATIRILVKINKATRKENQQLRDLISAMEAERNRLYEQQEIDQMTGIYNRTGMQRAWRRDAEAVTAVILIDGDGFKAINDRYGHTTGDAVICAIAETISSCDITAARYGGDEFVGLIYSDDPYATAETFRTKLRLPRMINGHNITLSATIGLCYVTGDRRALCDYIDAADDALYQGKAAGRNTIRITSITS
jgi:diguanylate cyclase